MGGENLPFFEQREGASYCPTKNQPALYHAGLNLLLLDFVPHISFIHKKDAKI